MAVQVVLVTVIAVVDKGKSYFMPIFGLFIFVLHRRVGKSDSLRRFPSFDKSFYYAAEHFIIVL